MSVVGRHLLAELEGCSAAIDDREAVERAMEEAVAASGATLLHLRVHPFEPQGITALALLSESHLALHTWPERGYAAADLFTCGDHVVGERAIAVLEDAFCAARVTLRVVERGPHPRSPASRTPGDAGSSPTSIDEESTTRDRDAGLLLRELNEDSDAASPRPHRVADAATETLNPQPSTLNPSLTEAAP